MGEATETRVAVERVVQDHAGWVFAAAKRRVGDAALAEDVTQAVFLLYWRKGVALGQQGKLAGWLYRAVRYCSANALRLKKIRQRHEQEAAMTRQQDQQGAAGWGEIEVELEGAMDRLSEKDRQAVVLRFYRGLSLREVGAALGLGEDAARMRVERAVEKLRGKLVAKGVDAETAGLSGLLLSHAGKGGVEGLMERIVAGTRDGMGSGMAEGIARGAGKMMVMAKVKMVAPAAAVLLGAGIWAGVVGSAAPPTQVPAATAGGVPATGPAANRLQAPTIAELLARLEEARKQVRQVHVRGRRDQYVMEGGNDQWQKTPCMAEAEAWIQFQPTLRFRQDTSLQITPWEQGAAPYYAESSRTTWDGQQGLHRITGAAHHDGGTLRPLQQRKDDHPMDGKDTQLLWLRAGWAEVGLPFVDILAPVQNETGCLGMVRLLASGDKRLAASLTWKIGLVEVDGEERVHLQVKQGEKGQYAYWFSPAHGWMCCRYEWRLAADGWKVTREWDVEQFSGSERAWYPSRASMTHWRVPAGGKTRSERWVYEADLVEVNQAAFDEGMFRQ